MKKTDSKKSIKNKIELNKEEVFRRIVKNCLPDFKHIPPPPPKKKESF